MREITGDKIVRAVRIEDKSSGTVNEMAVDGVFAAIGYIPSNDMAKQLGLELDGEGYIKVDSPPCARPCPWCTQRET